MIIKELLTDLKTWQPKGGEQQQPLCLADALPTDVVDLECYTTMIQLLSIIHKHYPNILGDLIFQTINMRTNRYASTDVLNNRQVMIRKWVSHSNNAQIELLQVVGNQFKLNILGTGNQFLLALKAAKQSWEFFSSKMHCSNLGLFPYMLDMFGNGRIEDTSMRAPLEEILNKSLPDWHPLLTQK